MASTCNLDLKEVQLSRPLTLIGAAAAAWLALPGCSSPVPTEQREPPAISGRPDTEGVSGGLGGEPTTLSDFGHGTTASGGRATEPGQGGAGSGGRAAEPSPVAIGGTMNVPPCVGDYVPGDYPPAVADPNAWLTIEGVPGQPNSRQYKVHVPKRYNCRVPTPLVFCIHGLLQDGVMFCMNGSAGRTAGARGFIDKSDEGNFILVVPNGAQKAWNGSVCCGNDDLDDVALFRAIFNEVATHATVDAKRIYATGFSNGGFMSYRLGCEAADLFTAIAPVAGGLSGQPCRPSRPLPLLAIHGDADGIIPYAQQAPSTAAVAAANGCSGPTGPASITGAGGDTTCVTHTGCPSGAEVTSCTVKGGGHVWFGDPSCGTGAGPLGCAFVGANSTTLNNTDLVWDFLKRFSK